jgi:hypothetical protein
VAVVVSTVFVFAASWGFVKVASAFMAVRASVREEIQGLDLVEHGVSATTDLDDLRGLAGAAVPAGAAVASAVATAAEVAGGVAAAPTPA